MKKLLLFFFALLSLALFAQNNSVKSTPIQFYPFLQSLTDTSVFISWHDNTKEPGTLFYAMPGGEIRSIKSTFEEISEGYVWHTVHLKSLLPSTVYEYSIVGSPDSKRYRFKTSMKFNEKGHVRFVMFGDTQDDSMWSGRVVRKAYDKCVELYGYKVYENINAILHTGDIVNSGSTIESYTNEFFSPFKPFTAQVPITITPGNHELDHQFFWKYAKYEEISPVKNTPGISERYWSFRIGAVRFIGLNANNTLYQNIELSWLDSLLTTTDTDTTIQFAFCFIHHPPFTELWQEGETKFVKERVLNVLKKHKKVEHLAFGHTHSFERGAIESKALNDDYDFRIICDGGGGGVRDRWGTFTNHDFDEIHTAYDHYFYIIYDVNTEDNSYTASMYSLGNVDYPLDNVKLDEWHHKPRISKPDKPSCLGIVKLEENFITLGLSDYKGVDSVMSAKIEVREEKGSYEKPIYTKLQNWVDWYGQDADYKPINMMSKWKLNSFRFPSWYIQPGNKYYYRVRYRDANLRWSDWSEEMLISR